MGGCLSKKRKSKKKENENERKKSQSQNVHGKLSQTFKLKSGVPRKNEYLQVSTGSSDEGSLKSPRKFDSADIENIPLNCFSDQTEQSKLLRHSVSVTNTKTVSKDYSELEEKLDKCRAENEYLLTYKRHLKHFLETTNQRLETMRRSFSSPNLQNLCSPLETYWNDEIQLLGDNHFDEEIYSNENEAEYQELTRSVLNSLSWLEMRLKKFYENNWLIEDKKRKVEQTLQNEIRNLEEKNRQTEVKLTNVEQETFRTEETLKQKLRELGEGNTQIEIQNKTLGEEIKQKNILLDKAKKDSCQLEQELETLQKQAAKLESSKDNLQKEIQNLEEKKRQIEIKFTNLEEETRQAKETLKQELRELGERNTQLEIQNKTLVEEIKQKDILLDKAKKDSCQLEQELETRQKQAAKLEGSKENLQKEIQNLEEKKRQTEVKLTNLEKETRQAEETLKQELRELGERNTQLEIQNKKLSEEFEHINVLLDKAKKDSCQLKQELENLQTQATKLEGIEDNMQREIQNLEEKTRQTEDKLTNLKEETRQTEETLKQELRELGERNTQLEIQNKKMMEEIDKLKSKPACQVQVFSPSSLPMMKQMQTELVYSIQKRLDAIVNDIEVVLCESIEKLKQDLPILLLCMNVSRLGTDAANAIHGLKQNSKMALVIFHHKDTHALPNQSSDRVLVDPTFKELGGIFDIAFLSGKGVYSCKMNEENISKIIAFLLKLEQAK